MSLCGWRCSSLPQPQGALPLAPPLARSGTKCCLCGVPNQSPAMSGAATSTLSSAAATKKAITTVEAALKESLRLAREEGWKRVSERREGGRNRERGREGAYRWFILERREEVGAIRGEAKPCCWEAGCVLSRHEEQLGWPVLVGVFNHCSSVSASDLQTEQRAALPLLP
jgi:hypothetical protein